MTHSARTLRIGSRGSQLALWQAHHIAALLRGRGHSVDIQVIKTSGDRMQAIPFAQVGSKGMFTKEIEEALAEGRVDLAVHSLKDLPTELPAPFLLAATPPRVDPRDVFVSVQYPNLAALPLGARVGTSSLRRQAQLKAIRPDIECVEFRGNVDTRLRKLEEGHADAILLAAAGLDRLEKTGRLRERLEPQDFCPAAGQGALGIETRIGDQETLDAVSFLNHAATRFAVTVERTALAALGGGCQVPIGIHCRPKQDRFFDTWQDPDGGKAPWDEVFAAAADPRTGALARVFHSSPRRDPDPVTLGLEIAHRLLEVRDGQTPDQFGTGSEPGSGTGSGPAPDGARE